MILSGVDNIKALFFLIQIIITMLILEIVSDKYLKNSTNGLYAARDILTQDEILGWTLKKDLRVSFQKKRLIANSQGFRIEDNQEMGVELITLGPSSALGWGVNAEETYTAVAAKNTQLKYTNASQIGFSLVQGKILAEKIVLNNKNQVKYVIISYGINDLDYFRFYNSKSNAKDTEYFSKNIEFSKTKNEVQNISSLFTLISLAYEEIEMKFKCDSLSKINKRVGVVDFINILNELIIKFKEKKIIPILIDTPYLHENVYSEKNIEILNSNYSEIERLANQKNCLKAINLLIDNKKYEPDRILKDVIILNSEIRKISNLHDVPFIEASTILQNSAKNFVDPVHPSAEGHMLIANELINIISRKNGK